MRILLAILFAISLCAPLAGQQKFPIPEFPEGYQQPSSQQPLPRSSAMEYLDLAVLVTFLVVSIILVHYIRRRILVYFMVWAALLYFGFYRQGCICAIGAIQNVALALGNPDYLVPIFAVGLLLLPLAVSLFYGRVFCGSVCPLGAIQDVVLVKGIRIPNWLSHGLGLIAFGYLGLAIVVAAIGERFLICEYDPFVAMFRLTGTKAMFIFGGLLLASCMFIGRAYCRFLCPLGAVFRVLGPLTGKKVTTTPNDCIKCRLCENACPFGAIQKPNDNQPIDRPAGRRRLVLLIALLPFLIAGFGFLGYALSGWTSRLNYTVGQADDVYRFESGQTDSINLDRVQGFQLSGQTPEELYIESQKIQRRFMFGGIILGGFMGLVIGGKLISLSVQRTRTFYQPDPSLCFACGRCWSYCPVEQKRRRSGKPLPSSKIPNHKPEIPNK